MRHTRCAGSVHLQGLLTGKKALLANVRTMADLSPQTFHPKRRGWWWPQKAWGFSLLFEPRDPSTHAGQDSLPSTPTTRPPLHFSTPPLGSCCHGVHSGPHCLPRSPHNSLSSPWPSQLLANTPTPQLSVLSCNANLTLPLCLKPLDDSPSIQGKADPTLQVLSDMPETFSLACFLWLSHHTPSLLPIVGLTQRHLLGLVLTPHCAPTGCLSPVSHATLK